MPPTARPPMAGRIQPGTRLRRNSSSTRVTPRIMAMPPRAAEHAEGEDGDVVDGLDRGGDADVELGALAGENAA